VAQSCCGICSGYVGLLPLVQAFSEIGGGCAPASIEGGDTAIHKVRLCANI
jgi:hypothetical protein